MKITYKDYIISKIGKTSSYNLIKNVIRTNTTGEKYLGKKTLGSMSLERCIETIINDSIAEKLDIIELSEYLNQFKEYLNNLKQLANEQIRQS